MVERKVAHVAPFDAIGTNDNALRLFAFVDKDTEGVCEDVFGIEICRQLEMEVGEREFADAVKCECLEWAVSTLRVKVYDIPSLAKELDAAGCDKAQGWLFVAIFLIEERDAAFLLHGVNDGCKMLSFDGYVFEKDAVLKREAFADDVAYGEGCQHPALHRVVVQGSRVADGVSIGLAVTINDDTEGLFNGVFIADECVSIQVHATAHCRSDPAFVNVF